MDWENFPTRQYGCWQMSSTDSERYSFSDGANELLAPFDVIWYRRAGQPMPNAQQGSQDFKIIHTESMLYLRSVVLALGHSNTLWVNPFTSAQRAELKVPQLKAAKAVGFNIPDTLIGNDFIQIKAFFDRHQHGIIYKAFTSGKWRNADGSATVLRTAALTEEHFSNPLAISACPGIYQEHIQKAYELRVTVIGDKVLAVKVDSQTNGKSVDWRYDSNLRDFPLSAINLPPRIAHMCLALCREMDLVFGCIDLIVDVDGNYVFLEINQAGQFLWIENIVPEIPLLDAFCRYLASGGDANATLPQERIIPREWLETDSFADFKARQIAKYGEPKPKNTPLNEE
jgi:glutathione synthase/RimK-type ligase-like ATP-grasp enzyme